MKTTFIQRAFILILLSISALSNSQNSKEIAIRQDIRLSIAEDKLGRPGPNLDVIGSINFSFDQRETGYRYTTVGFEYAHLPIDNFLRLYAGIGFTWNQLKNENIEYAAELQLGALQRFDQSFFNFAGVVEVRYKIWNRTKVTLGGRLLQRPDIKWKWQTNQLEHAIFVGLMYKFDKPKPKDPEETIQIE